VHVRSLGRIGRVAEFSDLQNLIIADLNTARCMRKCSMQWILSAAQRQSLKMLSVFLFAGYDFLYCLL
jgi:hypothetical protein